MWDFNISLWEKKYKYQDESSPEDTFKRIANVLATSSQEKEEFFKLLSEGRFLPGGRILAYAGTGLPCGTWMNCYTMGDPEDSMESILNSLSESAMTMKAGGGIGLNFSKLRPKGSLVKKTNSKSSGPVSFMEMWNSMSRTISGVNDRKGAMIAVLNVTHPDILEFIKAKENNSSSNPVLEKFNLSVGITDEFMNAVIEDKDWVCQFQLQDGQIIEKQYKAKEIMDEIVSSAWAKAEPGVVFLDTVNKVYNLFYTEEKITATNPCVTGDTRILTSKGYVPIKETVGKKVEIWNGYEWSEVVPFSTGINDILNVEFSNGITLKCTPYHKFILSDGSKKEAKDLQIGDKLKKYKMPKIAEDKEYSNRNTGSSIYVTKITKGKPEETFCFTEPKNHTGTFEGIVTGQCGEIPMPPYGACNLGSINLVAHIKNPFSMVADFDYESLLSTIKSAVKFLDKVVDSTPYPTEQHRYNAVNSRRIGLGFFGLGSALAMLGIRYGSPEAVKKTEEIMKFIRDNAYRASIELAQEKGAFPLYKEEFLDSLFIRRLPEDIQADIAKYGIRNSQLLAIAPTGSISQFAGNVSSGIEPIFSLEYRRLNYGQEILVEDYAWSMYKKMHPEATTKEIPDFFVTAHDISWKEHIDMQSICQQYIDGAISKTINLPKEITKEELKDVFIYAWDKGLKGCTIYREGSIDGEVLKKDKDSKKTTFGSRARPYKLESLTYKIKVPEQKHAFYLTFSHTNENKPIELFINTNDPTVQEWVRALGRLVSAVFRNVEDPTFLIDEFRQIYAPTGFWSGMRRKYIPSLVAEFGEIMEDYFTDIGILDPKVPVELYEEHTHGYCKICGQYGLVYEEGCVKCLNCGYNKCG